MKRFEKPFTQQEAIPDAGISRAVEVMRSGRLHRYNVSEGEAAEASLLEREYAAYQGADYCLACASGGYALHVAMRAAGLKAGDKVLANAYTLAPVPGAIHNAGGVAVLVEIDDDYHIDIDDLTAKAASSGARFLMLSHMRGHIADMDAVTGICAEYGIVLVEDCAHTMGARWKGTRSGNFGRIACFSTQTYKHLNSGEGGLLTTNDAEIAARAVVHSGSYMLYARHGAVPGEDAFQNVRLETPNYSGRMDNLRAAILRAQLSGLDENCRRWNERYQILADGFRAIDGVIVPVRQDHEDYVGSSIQFRLEAFGAEHIPVFIGRALERGVELKWFGEEEPKGFTSRYDSWRYLGETQPLPRTLEVLSTTCDMRVPLTFDPDDCRRITEIVGDVVAEMRATYD